MSVNLGKIWVPGFRNLEVLKDPHCEAYKRVFSHITDLALAQVFSEENLSAVVSDGASKHGLLRKGNLLQIMRGSPHPRDVAPQARKAVAAVALAVTHSPEQAAQLLDRAGIVTDLTRATQSITALQNQLRRQSQGLVNAYLHVTYACNLQCNHCYASSNPHRTETMPVENVARLVRNAARAGFGKAVITGGEPMAHPQRDTLLDALAALRPTIKPMQIVLRTNLAYSLTPAFIEKIAQSVDQIVVSIDGNQASHDARRGSGTYARTVTNLEGLRDLPGLSLTAVLNASQIIGAEGNAVRALGEELGIGVRFKPVLPMGRAATQSLAPEFYSSLDEDSSEIVAHRLRVASTCGLGMNLYIAPDGECFPCYALMGARHTLGKARADGLDAVLGAERFQSFKRVTVDSNAQCQKCVLRYLCGGFCRAWGHDDDPDAPPRDCTALHQRARELLVSALETLNVSVEQWRAAGLPVPDAPPTML
ncbi:MAG: radical SAM protein [Chloroflexi bacterium]|nr:radical SAM protein [Chloroflexota bacterium]